MLIMLGEFEAIDRAKIRRDEMRRVILMAVLPLVACQSPPKVTTPEAAAKAAWQICTDDWGEVLRRNDSAPQPFESSMWHAKLVGDHWHAWTGSETMEGTSVDVPVDGHHPPPGQGCSVQLQ
jgi:hypothetical protein